MSAKGRPERLSVHMSPSAQREATATGAAPLLELRKLEVAYGQEVGVTVETAKLV